MSDSSDEEVDVTGDGDIMMSPITPVVEQEEVKQDAAIFTLNEDIMMLIFAHLPALDLARAEMVCTEWRDFVQYHWRLRQTFNLDELWRGSHSSTTNQALKSILRKGCTQLKSVRLLGRLSDNLKNSGMLQLTETNEKLRKINVRSLAITDRGFGGVCALKNLQELSIDGLYPSDSGFQLILEDCQQLKCLAIIGNWYITGSFLGSLGSNMTSVKFIRCLKLTDEAIVQMCNVGTGLKELIIFDCIGLSSQAIRAITQSVFAKTLETLELSGRYSKGPESRRAVAMDISNCRSLKHLIMKFSSVLCNEVLESVSKGCQRLESLTISPLHAIYSRRVTDAGLLHVADNCDRLTNLDISHCSRVTDACFRRFANRALLVKFIARHTEIDEMTLASVIEECRSLRKADLYGCAKISKLLVSFIGSLPAYAKRCEIGIGGTELSAGILEFGSMFLPEGITMVKSELESTYYGSDVLLR